jgi:hypothetical protein
MENELSMLSGVFVAFIPVVATAMEALRSWIDKKKKTQALLVLYCNCTLSSGFSCL